MSYDPQVFRQYSLYQGHAWHELIARWSCFALQPTGSFRSNLWVAELVKSFDPHHESSKVLTIDDFHYDHNSNSKSG
jgi:hypothetical protein